MGARHILDTGALGRLLVAPSGGVARDLYRRGQRVRSAAVRLCPVDNGLLRSTITPVMVTSGGIPACRIGTNLGYALFVHDGTGIYGPRGTPIRPKRGRYLVFPARPGGPLVFARQVRGSPARPFLRDALPAARD